MRLVCSGWHRNHGQHTLFTGQLSDAAVKLGNGPIGYNEVQIVLSEVPPERRHGGTVGVNFRIDTRNSPLNGEYLMSLTLGKADILRLFRGAFDELKFGRLVEFLSDAETLAD